MYKAIVCLKSFMIFLIIELEELASRSILIQSVKHSKSLKFSLANHFEDFLVLNKKKKKF